MYDVILKPSRSFSVGKIVCVGQNYAAHIKEMNSKKTGDPVLFLKPSTALIKEGTKIVLPAFSHEVHHEVELALLVGKKAKNVSADQWQNYITGAGIALDLTLRDLQRQAKDRGLPWSVSKGFDGACPISSFLPLNEVVNIQNLDITLTVNGEIRQKGNTADMIWNIAELIAYITTVFTLLPGDIVLTGTPAGVSKLEHGDVLDASITHLGRIYFEVQ